MLMSSSPIWLPTLPTRLLVTSPVPIVLLSPQDSDILLWALPCCTLHIQPHPCLSCWASRNDPMTCGPNCSIRERKGKNRKTQYIFLSKKRKAYEIIYLGGKLVLQGRESGNPYVRMVHSGCLWVSLGSFSFLLLLMSMVYFCNKKNN